MNLRRYADIVLRISMGYTDVTVRVCVNILGALSVIPGPAVYSIHFSSVGYAG